MPRLNDLIEEFEIGRPGDAKHVNGFTRLAALAE